MVDKKTLEPSTKAKNSASSHLTVEELTEYFFAHGKKIDEYFYKESARINSHIAKCTSCRNLQKTFLLIEELGEGYMLIMSAVDVLKSDSASQKEKQEAVDYIHFKVGDCKNQLLSQALSSK